jgi:transcriptional regulator with XRE-family HTH domain
MITIDSERKHNIGKRIRAERIAAGYTQAQFVMAMGLSADSRQTATNWENGKRLPCIEDLLKMCEIFNCEMGYLLCEEGYNCKTRAITDIQNKTGLSEKAIEQIISLNEVSKIPPKSGLIKVLSKALENMVDLSDLLAQMKLYLREINGEHPYTDRYSKKVTEKNPDAKPQFDSYFLSEELRKMGWVVATPKEFSRLKFEDCAEKLKKLLDKMAAEQKEDEYGNDSKEGKEL